MPFNYSNASCSSSPTMSHTHKSTHNKQHMPHLPWGRWDFICINNSSSHTNTKQVVFAALWWHTGQELQDNERSLKYLWLKACITDQLDMTAAQTYWNWWKCPVYKQWEDFWLWICPILRNTIPGFLVSRSVGRPSSEASWVLGALMERGFHLHHCVTQEPESQQPLM